MISKMRKKENVAGWCEGIECATDYIRFDTNYISSGINSISFGITCISGASQFRQRTIPPSVVSILFLFFGSRWFSIF